MSEAYNCQVVEHFERPRNVGRFVACNEAIEGAAGDAAQGARFVLSAKIADEHIAELRFESYGCPHCIAAGSWLTQRLQGATCGELDSWTWREVADALDVPPEKRGRLLILEDAVRELAASWRQRT